MINQYDEYSQSSEGDADSEKSGGLKGLSKEMELEWADQLENMDRKPAAKIDPIKTSHLGKRLREPESELPVDMRPIHQLSAISKNPFST